MPLQMQLIEAVAHANGVKGDKFTIRLIVETQGILVSVAQGPMEIKVGVLFLDITQASGAVNPLIVAMDALVAQFDKPQPVAQPEPAPPPVEGV